MTFFCDQLGSARGSPPRSSPLFVYKGVCRQSESQKYPFQIKLFSNYFYSIPGIIRYCIKEKAKKKALQEDYDKWNEVKNL